MSAFYIKYLLLNRDSIKRYATGESSEAFLVFSQSPDLSDDIYLDLLTLEKEVDRLLGMNVFTPYEKTMLLMLKEGAKLSDIKRAMNLKRDTFYGCFRKLCEKLSYTLGYYFTDEDFTKTCYLDII